MNMELYTLNGKVLMDAIKFNSLNNNTPVINFNEDIILSYDECEDSALYYQLKQVLKDEIKSFKEDSFKKIYFFINFKDAFPLKDRAPFDALFENGVMLDFNGETKLFVPFLSSQSQSKKCIFAFIREDLFKPLRARLDLDLPFEKNIENKSFAFLPKLYAYRALYLSSSTEALRCGDELGKEFFTPENIIVLPEKPNKPTTEVKVFTAKSKQQLSNKGEAVLEQQDAATIVNTTCFDGEGIISPCGAKIINDHLKEDLRGKSFQVRMPFLKGMLHTVDFKKFLSDNKIVGDKVIIKDAFGIERDILKANIIIRPSVFKLKSLLDGTFATKEEQEAFCGKDVMEYYFNKLCEYNHGLYIVKTESSFKNTHFVRLSSQQLSTFDLSLKDVDGIIDEHLKMADAFLPQNIENLENSELLQIEDKPDWIKLLEKEPRFLNDPHIQTTIKNHRVSRYNDIAQGRILVKGENRFLSGDLYAFLVDIVGRVAIIDNSYKKVYDKLKNNRMKNGGVYMPGMAPDGRKVALLRSPHLSRNEDVCTKTFYSKEYNEYFKELTGVAMTGHSSYIPNALGGADFDGDQISIIYDKRIIHACHDSGYTEIEGEESALPFIKIEELQSVGKTNKYNYVSSDAVYNTFSNRIGNISNAAIKIAAVEYDKNIEKNENMFSAALCTILTGNEIDATKKGIRPYIDSVIKFSKDLNPEGKHIVAAVEDYIKMKRELESKGGEIFKTYEKENGNICVENDELSITEFSPNFEYNVVTQLLYRWAKAFVGFKPGTTQNLSKKAYNVLDEILKGEHKNSGECEQIFEGFLNACNVFSAISDNRDYIEKAKEENIAKAVIRLKGQYDDIYSKGENELSYKDKFQKLQDEIYKLTQNASLEELQELDKQLFSTKENEFFAENYWPYVKSANNKKLLEQILSLENCEMLLNFDFEGYRLLRYCLKNATLQKNPQNKTEIIKDNPYAVKYCALCNSFENANKSRSKFEKDLVKLVREDLAKALSLEINQQGCVKKMIKALYPLGDTKTIKAFWKVFSEREVIDTLGGEANA